MSNKTKSKYFRIRLVESALLEVCRFTSYVTETELLIWRGVSAKAFKNKIFLNIFRNKKIKYLCLIFFRRCFFIIIDLKNTYNGKVDYFYIP